MAVPKETGQSRGTQIDWRKLFRAVAYVVAVAVHTVLVVIGLPLLGGYMDFGYGMMGLLAAAFLAPVVLAWIVVVAWLVKRARAGLGFPSHIRRLVKGPVVIALVACFLHGTCIRVLYDKIGHPPAERNARNAEWLLELTEHDLQHFYYTCGHLPEDLEELAKQRWDEEDPASRYRDPFTGWGSVRRQPLHYVRLDSTNALLYSVGPDLDDDKGEKEFTQEQVRYHKGAVEWKGRPFGNWLYEIYGVSAKLDGDITRRVSLRPQESK
jgi:hypothetical protein